MFFFILIKYNWNFYPNLEPIQKVPNRNFLTEKSLIQAVHKIQ